MNFAICFFIFIIFAFGIFCIICAYSAIKDKEYGWLVLCVLGIIICFTYCFIAVKEAKELINTPKKHQIENIITYEVDSTITIHNSDTTKTYTINYLK